MDMGIIHFDELRNSCFYLKLQPAWYLAPLGKHAVYKQMVSTIVGHLLSFDPVIKPIIDNLPAG